MSGHNPLSYKQDAEIRGQMYGFCRLNFNPPWEVYREWISPENYATIASYRFKALLICSH